MTRLLLSLTQYSFWGRCWDSWGWMRPDKKWFGLVFSPRNVIFISVLLWLFALLFSPSLKKRNPNRVVWFLRRS